MRVALVWLCAVSFVGIYSLNYGKGTNKQVTRSAHANKVFLDLDHVIDGKIWLRVSNDSDIDIFVRGLPIPPNCEEYPEYYVEKVIQRKYTDEVRKAVQAHNPSLIDKTDEEIASQRALIPRTITIREEREMNWSDAFGRGCGTLKPKQKASFHVPADVAHQYERLYMVYYTDGAAMPGHQAPEHRLYFDLASLKNQK